MAKKPVGNAGFNSVKTDENGAATMHYVPDSLGGTKDEIERTVVGRFVQAMTVSTGAPIKWRQNPENDLDFTLSTPVGDVDLELTELVIIDQPGPPFAPKNKLRTIGDVATALVDRVRDKDAHYQRSKTPKHLLVYVTHFSFSPPDPAIALAQYALQIEPPTVLENVFYLDQPPTGPVIRCLFPVPTEVLERFEPDLWRDREYVHFDPTLAELKSSP